MASFEELQAAITDLRQKQIFFIGGLAKSGTTWLRILLDSHPQVVCKGEGHFLNSLGPALKAAIVQHQTSIADKNRIFGEIEDYPLLGRDEFLYILTSAIVLYLVKESAGKAAQAIGEKTPDNSKHFSAFNAIFPKAKFIHIVRDGRDAAVSGWFHNLRIAQDWTLKYYGSLGAYAKEYAELWVADLAEVQKFMDHHPGRVFQIRYKDLSANTEEMLGKVFAFLGVETSQPLLSQCKKAASFEMLSGRKPGQENRSSFFRKGVPGDWRNHLGAAEHEAFMQVAGEWLNRFGFA